MRAELEGTCGANHGGKLEIHSIGRKRDGVCCGGNQVASYQQWHKSEGQTVQFQCLSFLLSVLSLKEQPRLQVKPEL